LVSDFVDQVGDPVQACFKTMVGRSVSNANALSCAEMLRTAAADVAYREYPMGHEVSEQTLRDLAAWMKKAL